MQTAPGGKDGLEIMRQHVVQDKPFDLVFMDIQMPEVDAIEVTRRIRALEGDTGEHLPIIAMTAHAMQGDREPFIGAGMDGYMSKPIKAEELYRAVEEAAAGQQASACFSAEEVAVADSSLSILSAAETLDKKGDVEEMPGEVAGMLKTLGGDKELVAEMVALLLEDASGDMEQLQELLAARDGKNGTLLDHGLKGQLCNLGMKRSHAIAQALEKALGKGQFDEHLTT